MNRLRLDPADPLASLLAWLAALAAALGLDPSVRAGQVRLDRANAADVRRVLAAWRARLAALVSAEAARLARRLRLSLRDLGRGRSSFPSPLVGEGSLRAPTSALRFGPPRARRALPTRAPAFAGPGGAPDALIDPAEEEALRRRTRAVMLAFRDRSALVGRLAQRIAARLARASAALVGLRGRLRFPHPPRAIGARRALARKPEPRPPDPCTSVSA